MSGGDQAVAEISPKLSEYTHCLGITWNAQANTGTFCNESDRRVSSHIFLRLHRYHGLFCVCRVSRLWCVCVCGGGIDVKWFSCAGRGQKRLTPAHSSQPVPRFALPKRHPLSPNAFCHPGPVDVVHRVRGRPRVAPPPALSDRRWLVG